MITGRGPAARPSVNGRRMEWLAVVMAGGLALLLWQLLDSPWPWLLALGVLLLSALVGARRPGALAMRLGGGGCVVAVVGALVGLVPGHGRGAARFGRVVDVDALPRPPVRPGCGGQLACSAAGFSRSRGCRRRDRGSRPCPFPGSRPVRACPGGVAGQSAAFTR